MANKIDIVFPKTYATEANAEKAVCKVLGNDHKKDMNLRYTFVPVVEGESVRYGVLFFGNAAIEAHIHFHFNVVN